MVKKESKNDDKSTKLTSKLSKSASELDHPTRDEDSESVGTDDGSNEILALGEVKLSKEDKAAIKKQNKLVKHAKKAEKKIQKKIDNEGLAGGADIAPPVTHIKWIVPNIPVHENAGSEADFAKAAELKPMIMEAAEACKHASAAELERAGYLTDECIFRFSCARRNNAQSMTLWNSAIEMLMGGDTPHLAAESELEKFTALAKSGTKAREFMVLRKYCSIGLCGIDKRGIPVSYYKLGPIDPVGLSREVGEDILQKYLWYYSRKTMVYAHAEGMESGKHQVRFVTVVDMSKMDWGRVYSAIPIFKTYMTSLDTMLPERLQVLAIINVSSSFMMLWKIIKLLISEDTLKKVHMVPAGADILAALKPYIDASQVPEEYGGGMRCTSLPSGGWVPQGVIDQVLDEAHTVSAVDGDEQSVALSTSGEKQELSVAAGKSVIATVSIKKGYEVTLGLSLPCYDCDYKISIKPAGGEETVVVDTQRITATEPAEHKYKATTDVVAIVVLDNGYSYFRGKTVEIATSLKINK